MTPTVGCAKYEAGPGSFVFFIFVVFFSRGNLDES